MKKTLHAFFRKPTTVFGLITALMFQLIFSIIWITGYDGVTERIDQLAIGIVNEDAATGAVLVSQVREELPVAVQELPSLEVAKEELNKREIFMIMHIPASFSTELQASNPAALHYVYNEANPQMVKNLMQSISSLVTSTINKSSVIMSIESVLGEYSALPPEQAAILAPQLAERVISKEEIINPVHGFSEQMVPMMFVLASYVGAMIMSMNVQQSATLLATTINHWQAFIARGIINICAALLIGLVGTTMVSLLGVHIELGFLALWAFQSLFVMTFLFVAQIFLIFFGTGGMVFNIILLSVQLISSGTMIPRELLSTFYFSLSEILPATFATQGLLSILFGGTGLSQNALALLWIALAAIVLGALGTALTSRKKQRALKTKQAGEVI